MNINESVDQLCPCDLDCNPKDYEGRIMLFADEGYHNWYFSDLKRNDKSDIEFENAMSFVEMDRSYLEEN